LPRIGTEIEIETRVYWNEKFQMLKLQIPLKAKNCDYFGQTMFGHQKLHANNKEVISQKWNMVVNENQNTAMTIIKNCTYGSSIIDDSLNLTLLRSALYAGHPHTAAKNDRHQFLPCFDQGERTFKFGVNIDNYDDRKKNINLEALYKNEELFFLQLFPSGENNVRESFITVTNPDIEMSAVKKSESENNIIVRLFDSSGKRSTGLINIPILKLQKSLNLSPFEIKTFIINIDQKSINEIDVME